MSGAGAAESGDGAAAAVTATATPTASNAADGARSGGSGAHTSIGRRSNRSNAGGGNTNSAGASASGEGSSSTSSSATAGRRSTTMRTIGDVMRAPSTQLPDVVVLESMPEVFGRRDPLDPKEDLWLTTADGRYSSPIIPVRVGETPYAQTFYVHKHILLKSEWFEKALCGQFRESGSQSIDLPDEDPATFHFLVAYLYEGRYDPIKPVASVLVPDQDKGKGHAGADEGADSDSESASSLGSDVSALSRRRRERRRRREDRQWDRLRQKHPGVHRPNCNCPPCTSAAGPPCWQCRAPRAPPPPVPLPHPYPHPGIMVVERDPLAHPARPNRAPPRPGRRRHQQNHMPAVTPPPPPAPAGTTWPVATDPNGGRIAGEDLQTWLLAYELNLDVYILANKFLLEGFKREIARHAVDMLETAGSDAAVPRVLFLCRKLYEGLPENDALLKMIFARVGFLQPWRGAPDETNAWLHANPEIPTLIIKEMAARREDDYHGRQLPSMERPWALIGAGGAGQHGGGGGQGDLASPFRGVGGRPGAAAHHFHGWMAPPNRAPPMW